MPTKDNQLSLTLSGGQDTDIFFGEFRAFCQSVADCLKLSEEIVVGKKAKIRYKVVSLRTGSAVIGLEAVRPQKGPDRRTRVLGFFRKTVGAIQAGKKIDRRVSPEGLERFKRLAAPTKQNERTVIIDDVTITDDFLVNADRLLKQGSLVDGFVSGILERVNVHERFEFVLFPPISSYSIRCEFPDEMLNSVRDALKRTVTVVGSMRYDQDRPFPSLVRVQSIEVHPEDDELPSLSDLRGFARGCTDEKSAVEYVRAIRDE